MQNVSRIIVPSKQQTCREVSTKVGDLGHGCFFTSEYYMELPSLFLQLFHHTPPVPQLWNHHFN